MSLGLVLKDPEPELVRQVAALAEARGFTHLLFTELSIPGQTTLTGRDPFVLSSIALGVTATLRAGTGVAGTVFHTPRHLGLRAATLSEQSKGRFVLGCGVAHKGFADEIGVPYPSSPVSHAAAYCQELRTVRERAGFGQDFPVWLAALGDRMVRTGADHADGLILNWVSPKWTERAAGLAADSTGPKPTMSVFLRVGSHTGLRAAADRYLHTFDNYARHFARQGLSDADEVVAEACAPTDDRGVLRERVAAYREAGADLVLLYPADLDPEETVAFVERTSKD